MPGCVAEARPLSTQQKSKETEYTRPGTSPGGEVKRPRANRCTEQGAVGQGRAGVRTVGAQAGGARRDGRRGTRRVSPTAGREGGGAGRRPGPRCSPAEQHCWGGSPNTTSALHANGNPGALARPVDFGHPLSKAWHCLPE